MARITTSWNYQLTTPHKNLQHMGENLMNGVPSKADWGWRTSLKLSTHLQDPHTHGDGWLKEPSYNLASIDSTITTTDSGSTPFLTSDIFLHKSYSIMIQSTSLAEFTCHPPTPHQRRFSSNPTRNSLQPRSTKQHGKIALQ